MFFQKCDLDSVWFWFRVLAHLHPNVKVKCGLSIWRCGGASGGRWSSLLANEMIVIAIIIVMAFDDMMRREKGKDMRRKEKTKHRINYVLNDQDHDRSSSQRKSIYPLQVLFVCAVLEQQQLDIPIEGAS